MCRLDLYGIGYLPEPRQLGLISDLEGKGNEGKMGICVIESRPCRLARLPWAVFRILDSTHQQRRTKGRSSGRRRLVERQAMPFLGAHAYKARHPGDVRGRLPLSCRGGASGASTEIMTLGTRARGSGRFLACVEDSDRQGDTMAPFRCTSALS